MGGLFLPRMLAAVLIGAGACAQTAPAQAGDPISFAPATPGSQFMLYMTRFIGVRGAGANMFGLRYQRTAVLSLDPGARYGAAIRHRSLVDLQFVRGRAPRMQFGPRVTWDMGRGQLGPTELALSSWPLSIERPSGAPLAVPVP